MILLPPVLYHNNKLTPRHFFSGKLRKKQPGMRVPAPDPPQQPPPLGPPLALASELHQQSCLTITHVAAIITMLFFYFLRRVEFACFFLL